MIAYLDASALVKRYVVEAGSEAVAQLLTEAKAVGTATISFVEVVAALAKATRLGGLDRQEAEAAVPAPGAGPGLPRSSTGTFGPCCSDSTLASPFGWRLSDLSAQAQLADSPPNAEF
jgi:hypothetical protein